MRFLPSQPFGQVDGRCAFQAQDGRNQHIRPNMYSSSQFTASSSWGSRTAAASRRHFMHLHQSGGCGASCFTQEDNASGCHRLPLRPTLRWGLGVGLAPAGRCLAVESVPCRRSTERFELEPAHQQFAVFGIILVAAMKTADICRPPRDAGHAHAQPDGQLFTQRGTWCRCRLTILRHCSVGSPRHSAAGSVFSCPAAVMPS